jgi:hypothetical protein
VVKATGALLNLEFVECPVLGGPFGDQLGSGVVVHELGVLDLEELSGDAVEEDGVPVGEVTRGDIAFGKKDVADGEAPFVRRDAKRQELPSEGRNLPGSVTI